MKSKLLLLFSALLLGGDLIHAAPLGTAFTYQGRLDQNGQPANGTYQLMVELHSVPVGGTLLRTNLYTIAVSNGLFAVDMDFGALVFLGEERWLDLRVSTNGANQFEQLTPRTRLAPTPNAIFASTAGTVTNGAIQIGQLGTVGAPPGPGQVLGYDGSSLIWQPVGGISSVWTLNDTSAYYNGGNVGIGTSNPTEKLQVAGNGGISGDLAVGHNILIPGAILSGQRSSQGELIVADFPGALIPNPPYRFVVQATGNVGIGTRAPLAALHVVGNWDSGRPTLQLAGQKPSLIFAGDGSSGNRSWLMHVGANGPGNLEFYNRAEAGSWNAAMTLTQDRSYLQVEGAGGERAYIGGDGVGNDIQVGSLNPNVTDIYMYNAGSSTHMHAHVGVLTIHGGSDLAEPFLMKEDTIEKGSVVVIDDEHPGRLKRSTRAYDTRVAGIVSGANGIKPGIALKQEGALDQGENVALTGRVYVQADASYGAIKPGDLLTTSDTSGHAMKVTDHARAQGAILGKAMSGLPKGKGLVLVLVTLQ